jgi:hypothetical protein
LTITCRRSRKRIKPKMDAGGNFSWINRCNINMEYNQQIWHQSIHK